MDLDADLDTDVNTDVVFKDPALVRTAWDIIGERDKGCPFDLQICHHDGSDGQVSSTATL